jgi:class 3 adenylate cyclase
MAPPAGPLRIGRILPRHPHPVKRRAGEAPMYGYAVSLSAGHEPRGRQGVRARGLEIRAGLHTGERELAGGGRVTGIAVHIGARIAGLAGAGEVLVSSTVKDLVAGAGIAFEDRGEHGLRGVPDRWRLYAVT